MKKIYWMVQQLNRIGGTEMVSIELMKNLSDTFDITLISVAEIEEPIVYDLGKLRVQSLNVPIEVCRYDEFLSKALKAHHYGKALKLTGQLLKHFIFKRNAYRNLVASFSTIEDLIIASSLDSYIFTPLNRKAIFHYHFNAETYLSLSNRLMSLLSRKSDWTVFLTQDTFNHVLAKQPNIKGSYIYNPSRFKAVDIKAHEGHRFIFSGRLEKQKNPMCLLETMLELKKMGINFHLDILGTGSYEKVMHKYILENDLTGQITMHGQVQNIETYLMHNDINLLTSTYEGFPLSIIEATSFSLYNISTNWGDALVEAIDGQNGIIVDSFEPQVIARAISEVLKQDLNQLKHQSYLDAARFDIQTIKQDWINLIQQIMDK